MLVRPAAVVGHAKDRAASLILAPRAGSAVGDAVKIAGRIDSQPAIRKSPVKQTKDLKRAFGPRAIPVAEQLKDDAATCIATTLIVAVHVATIAAPSISIAALIEHHVQRAPARALPRQTV